MLRNYLKIAWRNIVKKKTFSIINIIGLSVSVAFCLLLFFYIRHEQSYDTFHAKKDRLFRLEMTNIWAKPDQLPKKSIFQFLTKGDNEPNHIIYPLVVAGDLQTAFPEVNSTTRFKDYGKFFVRANKEVFKEEHVVFADNNFFTNFSFRLTKGDPKTVFASSQNIVLSETAARTYFGKENPIGKIIELIDSEYKLYTVAGIAEDAPQNSSIQYGIIAPLLSDPGYAYNMAERFNHSTHMIMVELGNNVSKQQFEQKMNRWVKTYFAENLANFKDVNVTNYHWHLRPLADCHYSAASPWGHFSDATSMYQLACLAIVILLIAALNYILLAISNAASRVQEIGVRKVMGANKWLIILQCWVETQVVVILAVLLGLVLAVICLPLFNDIVNSNIKISYFSWKEVLPALLILNLVLGFCAGFYPAFTISKLKPLSVIKSFQTFKIKPRFSKVLVVLQYTFCVVLMIAAFIIDRQMNFINNKNLGFDKEQVLIVKNPTYDYGVTQKLRDRLSVFAASQPYIVQYSGMNGGLDGGGNQNGFILNGKQTWLTQMAVDYNYFNMLGLTFVQGRPFSKDIAADTSSTIRPSIVNETLFKLLGKDAKLGVYNETIYSTIIGVVKDYHFESLSKKIEPAQHVLPRMYVGSFLFKIRPGEMKKAITNIEKHWKQLTTDYPFEYTFLDQKINQLYQPQQRWLKTIRASGFFAIFIACMGLFGLSAINAANRTKEIGIRKVLGAGVKDIVMSLSTSFLALVGIAILVATPLAWLIMNNWLQDFAYRITISWWMFAIVGITALLIALATVSFQAIKAALANPVKALRSE